jgi:hypothetical protein
VAQATTCKQHKQQEVRPLKSRHQATRLWKARLRQRRSNVSKSKRGVLKATTGAVRTNSRRLQELTTLTRLNAQAGRDVQMCQSKTCGASHYGASMHKTAGGETSLSILIFNKQLGFRTLV